MELLHASPTIEIARISKHVLYCKWVGPQTPESIISAGSTIIQLVKEGEFKKVLNDSAHLSDHFFGWYHF